MSYTSDRTSVIATEYTHLHTRNHATLTDNELGTSCQIHELTDRQQDNLNKHDSNVVGKHIAITLSINMRSIMVNITLFQRISDVPDNGLATSYKNRLEKLIIPHETSI